MGTRNGDIYEIIQKTNTNQQQILKRLSSFDQQIPKVLGFSTNNDRIFFMSEQGYLCVWKFQTLTLLCQKDFNLTAVNMVVCKKTPHVILAFEFKIIALSTQDKEYKVVLLEKTT